MKTFLFCFILLNFLCPAVTIAQENDQFICGDNQLKELLRNADTAYDMMERKSNIQINTYRSNSTTRNQSFLNNRPASEDSGYVIPVVVHVIYPAGTAYGTGTNISYAQIRSQIEALNAAFSKTYPAYNGQSHPDYAVNTKIRFCLARSSNSGWAEGPGGTEFGVKRYPENSTAYNHFISQASAMQLMNITHPDPSTFPFDKFLNIWVVSTIEGGNNVMGYAPRPLIPVYPLDGVVMRADIFGDNTTGNNFNLSWGLAQGKILAHEVGHYLNLYHIFQGDCRGANPPGATTDACDLFGDMICDIEPCTTQNIYCGTGIPNTCTAQYPSGTTNLDMINDYMSYADDNCMNTFTLNQAERMWATLNLQRPGLWHPDNLASAGVIGSEGCIPSYLNARIVINKSVYCSNKPILLSNPDAGNTAITRQWQFPGGIPETSTANIVSINYLVEGNYVIRLTVSDGVNTRTDSMSIVITECKLDSTSLTKANWYFGNFGSIDFTPGFAQQTFVAFERQTIQGELSYPDQLGPFINATLSPSDSLGNLLFYCNGVSIWNKNHQKITSTPMFGRSDINASTGLCYIPYPGKRNKYFVAGVYPNFDEQPSGIRCVLIDLDSNSVTPYQEFNHAALPSRFSQFLTVVPHCNGIDYWIITKGFGTENTNFYSFLVTESGIDFSQLPIISSGFVQPGYGGSGNQLKSNSNGTKLLLFSPHGIGAAACAMYDFDNLTGRLNNEKQIPDVQGYNNIQGGGAFSPNGEYFYIARSSNFLTNGLPYWMFQYRVSDLRYKIFDAAGFYFAAIFQTGPDGNIYIATQEDKISRISNPDVWGGITIDGNFINMRAVYDEIRTNVSLPAFIDAKKPDPARPDFTYTQINCNTFQFNTRCLERYTATWDFGDGTTTQAGHIVTHTFNNAGISRVKLTISISNVDYGSVSKMVEVPPLTAEIFGPSYACTNGLNPFQYSCTTFTGADYNWQVIGGGRISGANDFPIVNITWPAMATSGRIKLTISKDDCVLESFKTINLNQGIIINWSLPEKLCITDDPITLTAYPTGGSFTIDGVSGNTFSPPLAGLGNHVLIYTYSNETNCASQLEKNILILPCNLAIDNNTECDTIFNSISLVPNLITNNQLQINSTFNLNAVSIFNAVGQKVFARKINDNLVNISTLSPGMYYLVVNCHKSQSFKAFRFYKL